MSENGGLCLSDLPHAPIHKFGAAGAYMVTAGTYGKLPLFDTPEKKEMLMLEFFRLVKELGWQPQAWAFLNNHYHVVVVDETQTMDLAYFVQRLHGTTAFRLNNMDALPGRQVWYQYWDRRLTSAQTYWARIKYAQENPVHHRLVLNSVDYRWCSARWFSQHADAQLSKMLTRFSIAKLNELDEF